MTIGHQLGLRLFLEGVETPVIAASITIAPDTPAAASIQVIATDKIFNLLPRTVVHLFFYDFVDASSPIAGASTDPNLEDQQNSQYKLLFMGELQGIAFQKDAGSRQVVLQCVDFSNYWDTTYQYNFGGSLLGGRRQAAFIGANTNLLNGPLGHGQGTVAMLFNTKSVNFPELEGVLAGIVHCLEAIGGSYYGDTTFRGVTDFTSIAELRLKVLQQICAAEKDSSTKKLFARKAFNMWMNRQIGSLPKLVTFRGIVEIIQKFVFHNIFPCPVSKYVDKVTGLTKSKTYVLDIAKDPRARVFIDKVKQLRRALMSAKDEIQRYDKTDVFEGQLKFTQTSAQSVTHGSNYAAMQCDLKWSRDTLNTLLTSTPSIPGLLKEVQIIDHGLAKVGKNIATTFAMTLKPDKLQDSSRRLAAVVGLEEAIAACDTILGFRIKTATEVTYDKRDRVNNQILRPDIWFCAAPQCNVLFPEMYQSFQWSRNFLREVTRLELQTTHEILGDDALFNGFYYAPNNQDMRTGKTLSDRQFRQAVMEHELFTGIIPMFEKMCEVNIFAMKSSQVNYKGAKVPYAQRSVNHQYFKYRFATRQMTAEGRFNPWYVPGFPGVIIDRPMNADQLAISGMDLDLQLKALKLGPATKNPPTKAQLLMQLVPNQFFGCCTGLTHTLGQQGGMTSYNFEQARIHRESAEFMGVDKVKINRKTGEKATHQSVVASASVLTKGGKGPKGGVLLKVLDVSDGRLGQLLPLAHGKGMARVGDKVGVPTVTTCFIGSNKDLFTASTQPTAQPTSPAQYESQAVNPNLFTSSTPSAFPTSAAPVVKKVKGNDVYRAYDIVERFDVREQVEVDVPIEEAIHPPWMWDGWRDLMIGETYMQFFGTNSITDLEKYTTVTLLEQHREAQAAAAHREAQEGIMTGSMATPEVSDEFYERQAGESDAAKAVKNTPEPDLLGAAAADQKVTSPTVTVIDKERTIEAAVDYLVRVYSFIKKSGMDVGDFIRNYTWRPVATMVEIMGSSRFYIRDDFLEEGKYMTFGREGFHSRAFGDKADLFGLVDPSVKKVLGLSGDKGHAMAKKLDVRARRRQAVWAYVEEITSSKGLLG